MKHFIPSLNEKDLEIQFQQATRNKILALAPMVNNSSKAYRILARRLGARLVYTEMINCESYLRGQHIKLMDDSMPFVFPFQSDNLSCEALKLFNSSTYDLVIQVCGNSVKSILKCVDSINSKLKGKFFSIDLNLGCPQKIAKRGNYGAYFAENTEKTYALVKELCVELNKKGINLTCKIRLKNTLKETLEYAKTLESCGISMIAVHGRTITQKGINTGMADWHAIKCIKEVLKIPVLANGNIACKKDVIDLLEYTKCDGVMVAETHLYNPFIFYITGICEKLDIFEYGIYGLLKCYINLCKLYEHNFGECKSHIYKILHKFITKDKIFFEELNSIKNIKGYEEFIEKYKENLRKENCEPKLRFPYLSFLNFLNPCPPQLQ